MLLNLILNTLALYLTANIIPGIKARGTFPVIAMVIILALLNIFLRPLFFIITIPLTIFTFGLFLFVLNGFIFYLAANLIKGFEVENIGSGILGWIFYSIFSLILNALFYQPALII